MLRFLRSGRNTKGRWRVVAVVAAAGCTALAGCQGSSSSSDDGVLRFAEFPGSVPNWILPITDPAHTGSPNTYQFSYLMWRPLYWQGTGSEPTLDDSLSLADAPAYSDGNRTVTVTLKNYQWSNGKPVTSRDVEFWWNLVKANTDRWSGYVAGNLPDNVASFEAVNDTTFRMRLKDPVSPQWFTNNQLSLITPMPQAAWDKTTPDGAVSDADRTPSGAKAVLTFLMDHSKQLTQYAKDPLWKVVDGPWNLTAYDTEGHISFVPNPKYSGSQKPTVKRFDEVPFETDSAELNSLLAGDVDYGYLPFASFGQRKRVEKMGYHFSAWNLWTINYIAINYNHPTTGPIVSQRYVRQALESLVNQKLIIEKIFQGQGHENFSPISHDPKNPYATVAQNPNPYDPDKAVSLLKAHGWDVKPNGVTTCTNAGTAANQCGAGIPAGAKLSFTLIVNSGNHPVNLEMQELKSEFSSKAGIELDVHPQPFTTVISTAFASCTKAKPQACSWEMADWGGGSNLSTYPTGEDIFASKGSSNAGHIDDPALDRLIQASQIGGADELRKYEQYVADQVSVIWVPNLTYQLSMIRNSISGADQQNPFIGIAPELWKVGK